MLKTKGLHHNEAEQRLAEFGFNEIVEMGGRTKLKILRDQFGNGLVWLLLAAAVVAGWLGDMVDMGLILAIVVVNSGLGWMQEFKAEKAVEKLKQMRSFKVRVMRAGREEEVDSREVVPGDVVFLEAGSRVPADGKTLEVSDMEIDEAVLTGESMPVLKAAGGLDMVYMGTMVVAGSGWMEVVQTGMRTKFGQLALNLERIVEEPTPLQKKLAQLGRVMVGVGLGAAAIVTWYDGWLTGVSLAVAVIPEGLPAVIAISLAVGGQKLARQKAIVRRLGAIETLGAADVIASDKTGTITKNEMRVKKWHMGGGWQELDGKPDLSHGEFSRMMMIGILCNSAVLVWKHDHGSYDVLGDQTEGALLKMAQGAGIVPGMARENYEVVREYPFDSKLKLMSVVVSDKGGKKWIYTKGAPEQLLSVCRVQKAPVLDSYREMAGRGFRVIGMAYRAWEGEETREEVEKNLRWAGMVAIADPIREEIRGVVERAKKEGVRIIMVTGDSELTANAIATEAGMIEENEEIMNGEVLERISDEQLAEVVMKVRIFARVNPVHKLRIVKALQKRGQIVVVTGDGVNDALALKQADVGVAMGKSGTDVARETADMVLQDDNLATVVRAIEGGRMIMGNITRSVVYLLSCNLAEILTIMAAAAAGWPTPLLPVQILWINLVTDGMPALALAIDGSNGKVQAKRNRQGWVLGRSESSLVLVGGLVMAGVSLAVYGEGFSRAAVFTTLVMVQLAMSLVVRGWTRPQIWQVGAIVIGAGLQLAIITNPVLRQIFRV